MGGTSGLLDLLGKKIVIDTRLDELGLRDKTVGIDAFIWLIAAKEERRQENLQFDSLTKAKQDYEHVEKFKAYCEKRFKLLNKLGIKSLMVFDGNATPLKNQIKMLKKKIKDSNKMSRTYDSDGDIVGDKPKTQYIPQLRKVVSWLQEKKVDFIVAPYEADAQLTYLAVINKIYAVITEDSDLIPFGCPRVIFKLDVDTQHCRYYSFDYLKNHKLFKSFTQKMLLEMCILIGCDYIPNVEGIGKGKAKDALIKYKNYDTLITDLKDLKLRVGANELEKDRGIITREFNKAIKAFTYQQVYDPDSHTCKRLSHIVYNDLREDEAMILGPVLKNESVQAIASGIRPSEIKESDIKLEVKRGKPHSRKRTPLITTFFKPGVEKLKSHPSAEASEEQLESGTRETVANEVLADQGNGMLKNRESAQLASPEGLSDQAHPIAGPEEIANPVLPSADAQQDIASSSSNPQLMALLRVPPLESLEPVVDKNWVFLKKLSGRTLGARVADDEVRAVVTTLLNRLEEELPATFRAQAQKDLKEILDQLNTLEGKTVAFRDANLSLRTAHATLTDTASSCQQLTTPRLSEIKNRIADLKSKRAAIDRQIEEAIAEESKETTAIELARQKKLPYLVQLHENLKVAKSATENVWHQRENTAARIGVLGLRLYCYKTEAAQTPQAL